LQRAHVDPAEFRRLLETAVCSRAPAGEQVWTQLSGGLDSSSVTALLATHAPASLGGTITLVDSLGEGDERAYASAVADMYHLRNEHVSDCWAWQDDGEPPPLTSQPTPMYPFFARERKIGSIVRGSGARVLLTGHGADHYLSGSLDYITDLASAGHVGAALQELTTWSIATRQSFWGLGRRYLLDPFVPRALQAHAAAAPSWLSDELVVRLRHEEHTLQATARLSRFASMVVAGLQTLPSWLVDGQFGSDIELRHPFLYRPLVEWSLQLPPQHRIRPHARKWILRESLRDVLPEIVRTRSTKGGIDARILWSLQHERARVDALLRDPILAQLGCVDAARLRRAVD
jgi:asparagine synthase (glutamine-hydrolysing)